ncbi:NUDIX hydrolase [Fictibacillus barbaricus]|uniref:ADP-ribose pyrophosphatase n=1 Tax=Fictibacillus barbaricus TaxID=182136 RepID=A0ABU1TVW4_9BACL|nr:NUDIX hydrolase [Fictibacillus barbaricus]MDR7071354.1 ADP-ribose pyrophosphatase [Fictibacillus barbaricus]
MELVYQNREKDIEVYEDEFGKITLKENQNQAVVMVAVEGDHLVLISQYRPAVDEVIIQLPGGGMNVGEDPNAGAKRELLEETGIVCGETVFLGSIQPSACLANTITHVYFTRDILEYQQQMLEKKEASIQAFHIPIERAFHNIEKGIWKDSELAHGLLLARLKGLI